MTKAELKITEITHKDIPQDPVEKRKFAIKLINEFALEIAQNCKQEGKEDLETLIFRNELQSELAVYAAEFFRGQFVRKHNLEIQRWAVPSEKDRKEYKVKEPVSDKPKVKKPKAKADINSVWEKRGKSAKDKLVIDLAKGFISSFKHLPEAEGIKAAFQMAESHYEKIMGKK